MDKIHIAVDLGASGGRCIPGKTEDGKLNLMEPYRFDNGMAMKNGHLCWDTEKLFDEILTGIELCGRKYGEIASVGVDTWGVDFVLLDNDDRMIGDAVGYRDARTEGMDAEVAKLIPEETLYARTGILKASYNTIYQLMALKLQHPEYLEKAETMLMMPDYFHFLLSGEKVQEYTEATTSQLIDPVKRDWDWELIELLGLPRRIFQKIVMPGTKIGRLRREVFARTGFDCDVVLPATHDTQSAILALPTNEQDTCFISSGTWSLMGVELDEANTSAAACTANLTNEGGYGGKICFLANIMGLWMVQSVRKELNPTISYGDLCEQASRESIQSLVDPFDDRFLAPQSMTEAVKEFCEQNGQVVPQTLSELACVIYHSLAACYARELETLEKLTGKRYDTIHVIGGGSNADYLNELTARYTKRKVVCGPGEATAIGNLLAQMTAAGEVKGVEEARGLVAASFSLKTYG